MMCCYALNLEYGYYKSVRIHTLIKNKKIKIKKGEKINCRPPLDLVLNPMVKGRNATDYARIAKARVGCMIKHKVQRPEYVLPGETYNISML